MKFEFEQIRSAVLKKGYAFFDNGNYNLNIVGVRSNDANANTFNDVICVLFYVDGLPYIFQFDATTDPGVYWRHNPMHHEGTAIMVPGQTRGLWKIGLHQGKYPALVQRASVKVYRDNNCDEIVDCVEGAIRDGWFGINLHHAGATEKSKLVGRWSAGCQVVADPLEFELLMALCAIGARYHGDSFTYTLLTEFYLQSELAA